MTAAKIRAFLALSMLCTSLAMGQDKPPEQPPAQQPQAAQPQGQQPQAQADPMQAEFEAALKDAKAAGIAGPASVPLMDQASMKLPEGYLYFPGKQSGRLLRAMGNRVVHDPLGMVVGGESKPGGWFVVMQYDAAGYVKDDDAKEWNADELLKNIREGTDAANEDRRKNGLPESEIIGWIEAPKYDSAQHRLVWSLASKLKGDDSAAERTVNYNTYALGREGYISLNLVTGMASVETEKAFARELLSALEFSAGKKYEEFNSSTDKVAEYGLAALVGGIAAKKLGLLAVIAAFALKFAKVIGVAVLGGGAVLAKVFKGRKAAKNANEGDGQA